MTNALTGGDVLRRHFVAIATSAYEDPRWWALDVEKEVSLLRDWLCSEQLGDRRFVPLNQHLAENPDENAIRSALQNPPYARRWTANDAAVVYVTGHGEIKHDNHWLVLQATEWDRIRSTALRTADLAGWLTETDIKHLLLIFDLCYAGQTVVETGRFDEELPPNWLVLASATKSQKVVTSALTEAINGFLEELASDVGQKYGVDAFLEVATFVDEIQNRLGDQRLAHLAGSPLSRKHACLPNPHYRAPAPVDSRRRDLALPQQDLLTHWGPRSRGVVEAGDPGWLFTGRDQLMRELIDAAVGEPGVVLVTGGAGSGKSAALARLVTLSDPVFIEQYRDQVAAIPSDLIPPPGAVDVAVLATGKRPDEVISQICRALRVPTPRSWRPVPTLQEWIGAWQSWLAEREKTVTLVIDALDEASDPQGLLLDVLTQLGEGDGHFSRVRLLLGVRSSGGSGGVASYWSPHEPRLTAPAAFPFPALQVPELADRAETELAAHRIRVDEQPWWRQEDVASYAAELLQSLPDSPYAERPDTARAVAEVLAQHAGKSFLITRVAAASLAHRHVTVDPQDPHWLATVSEGVLGVFRDDLRVILPDPDERRRAVNLLRAVAFAYGRGLPWRDVWPAVTNAVASDPYRTFTDSDIAWLLATRLAAYLITDREDGDTVYRLFHDELRDTLREFWVKLLG
ncbi:AAA family ATPase [Streptomyces sp. NPDC059649]|uniref:AAA family ATPase n=1 Tax=Streptomyces sp. NPDC059649 TaxID=3346895 RepID=UPI00367A6721